MNEYFNTLSFLSSSVYCFYLRVGFTFPLYFFFCFCTSYNTNSTAIPLNHYTSIGIGSIYLYIHKYGLHDDPVGFMVPNEWLYGCYMLPAGLTVATASRGDLCCCGQYFEGDSDRFFIYLLDTIESTIYLYYGRSEDFFDKY